MESLKPQQSAAIGVNEGTALAKVTRRLETEDPLDGT
jgi:hypothetical protein